MLAEAAQSTSERSQVIAALKQASDATGSDFHFLLNTALRESSLKTEAQSSTSSACGLFQFVGQTWLGLIKEHGAKYGLGAYADAISRGGDGRYHVANAADRQAILALRKDPRIAALMEGEFAQSSKSRLEETLGRRVCSGELYAAHFLGPAAACKLIQTNESDPGARAASLFPQAADANRSVFYHADGTAKTVREVYDWALGGPASGGAVKAANAPRPVGGTPAPTSAQDRVADPDASMLLWSLASWQPARSSYSSLDTAESKSLPSAPFLLTPGVMDILSSLSPVSPSHT